MGNNTIGSAKIAYNTKEKIPIEYIYYDLKGKNRFPPEPSERQIELMFEKCIREIEATSEQIEMIRDFNPKYKFRFVILHGRKFEEYRERNELNRLRRTQNFDENMFKGVEEKRKKELSEQLSLLENNETAIKMHLGAIDRYISEKNAWVQFIKINGIERLVKILDKAISANKQGTKTIFQNQIEILKFLKSLSDHNQKEYFQVVSKITEYPIILLRAYHPVNVAVTAYVLLMLQDYSWKVQNGMSIIETMKNYQAENELKSFLDPFVETIYETNNILMCFYNLRFINEMIISIVDENDKGVFEAELHLQRYELLIEDVKNKLQENYYKSESCTFQAVSQQIYKYATRTKKTKENLQEILMNRATTNNNFDPNCNFDALQQHLLVNFVEGFINNNNSVIEEESDDNDDDYIMVHLIDSDKKSFNKFILDTFNEIQHYYKYTIIIDEFEEGGEFSKVSEELEKIKQYGLSSEEYIKRIKGSCMKNGCEDAMLSCLKAMQYFQKSEWKRLETFVLDEIKVQRFGNEADNYKRQLEQKERQLKTIKKEFYQLKTDMVNMSMVDPPRNNPNVSKIDMTLFDINSNNSQETNPNLLTEPKKLEVPQTFLNPVNINSLSNVLPPPLHFVNNNIQLSPPPTLNNNILPPPPSLITVILPPPPGLNTILPPPPTLNLGGLLTPPLNNILPPPPSFNTNILPPPPSLNISILPPPPNLNGLNLPPPPTFGTTILPPPPSLNGLNLPPPPSFNPSLLPPPPSINGLLPNLPPIGGLPSLPGLGLPSLPGLGGLSLPSLFAPSQQKLKQKRQPKVTLKNCNYKTLSYNEIQKTVFSQIDDSKVKLDEDELETLFSRKEPTKVQSALVLPTEPKKKEPIKIIGSDRWRNMEIVLTKLRIPNGAIFEALTTCSGKFVVPTILESLKSLIPSEEEEMNISAYDGDIDDLGRPERFLKELISVPEYSNRIKSLHFNAIREELYFDLQKSIEDLTIAFESLKSNYRLHHILEIALAIGNYLNGTGIKGGAWGFKLDTLERLAQVKTQNSPMNAGLYIIKQVWKKYQYPIFDKEEVDMYQSISKMPISQIKIDLAEIKRYSIAIEKAFKSKNKNDPNDRIDEHCEEILLEVKGKYEQLDVAVKKLEIAYTDCATYYCEDPTKAASDEIGKKLFQSVLFIFNTEKIYYEMEEKRKKDEARKAVKNQIKFSEKTEVKKEVNNINPESKINMPMSTPIKLPMPTALKSGIVEISSEDRMKQVEKMQQEKEKKFLQEMMKKRNSKMVAFRQSKAPTGGAFLKRSPEPEIDFLKGL